MTWRGGRGNYAQNLEYDDSGSGYRQASAALQVAPAPAPALTYPSGGGANMAIEDDPFAVIVRTEGGISVGGKALTEKKETAEGAEGVIVAADDPDQGPRQMLEVFLKSAPFLKVRLLTVVVAVSGHVLTLVGDMLGVLRHVFLNGDNIYL